MKINFKVAIALAMASIGSVLFQLPAAAAEQPKCGINNGKVAAGEPIQVGAVVSITGPGDISGASGAEAYFNCVNKNGGINGRPIAYTVEDDAWRPEQAAQLAAKLVKDKKVVALIANSSFVDCAVNKKLYEAEDVLIIAATGAVRDCFHSRNIAPINAGPRLSSLGVVMYMAKAFGTKNVVCLAPNVPGLGDWGCDGIGAWGADKGITYHNIQVDLSSPDMTSVLLQAASLKPDLIVTTMPRVPVVALLAAAEQQDLGEKIHFAAPTSVYSEDFPKAIGPYWDRKFHVHLELEPLDKNSPDNNNWHAVLNGYGRPTDHRDTFSQSGYLAARVLVDVMLQMDPNKIDRRNVTAALRKMKGFRSDILCGPWYFGEGNEHNANHAGSVAVVQDNKYVTKESCFQVDDPSLADIRKMEAATHIAD